MVVRAGVRSSGRRAEVYTRKGVQVVGARKGKKG